jgi:hypothetical protein
LSSISQNPSSPWVARPDTLHFLEVGLPTDF